MENVPNRSRAFLYFAAGAVLLALFYFLFISAPFYFKPGSILSIEEGMSLRKVSLTLKEDKLIRSRVAFETFVIIYGGERHMVIGDYLFDQKLPVFEIARRIARGEHHLPPVKVTIPEGFDNQDIAKALSVKLTNFDSSVFLSEAADKQGYLFPDTYFFFSTSDQEDALKYMESNFTKKIAPLLPDIAASGHSESDIIVMASIIEREAEGDADREYISGILWKRLSLGMPLEVDAAPETYKTKGLPAEPVSNPGLLAIKAAIHPSDSPYLFYLHDKNGNIHYAKTFAEHKANELKYLK
jgi:UPF0755 protein